MATTATELRADVKSAVQSIAFFGRLKEQDAAQYRSLLQQCEVLTASPGEPLLRQGENATGKLYFIVTGSAEVYADGRFLSVLPAGETFGDMALFVKGKRRASIRASADNTAATCVLVLNTAVFGELNDFSQLSCATKILFYRMHVQRARWRLEKYRIQFPDHPFFNRLPNERPIAANDDEAELKELHQQAVAWTHFLLDWNALGVEAAVTPGASAF